MATHLPSQTQTLNVPPVGQLVVVVALVLYDALHHTALGRPHTLQGFRVVFRVAPQHVLEEGGDVAWLHCLEPTNPSTHAWEEPKVVPVHVRGVRGLHLHLGVGVAEP